jgi:hypothetical protein
MSRAYRIKVKESARHVIRAGDHVSTTLEILDILPAERTAELLAVELERRGFTRRGNVLSRVEADGVVVEIDATTAAVTVKVEEVQKVTLEGERQGWTAAAAGKVHETDRESLRQEVLKDLQRQAEQKSIELQKQMTDRLEGKLGDLRKELDQAANRVAAEALKEKAASMGQIKEMTEDAETGSLTIVLEV